MKKNFLRRAVTLALSAVMAVSMLAGCGNKDNGGSSSADAEWTAFKDNVTIQIPVYDRGEDGDETNNYWTKWIQSEFGDKYNITVQFVTIGRGTVLDDYNKLANAGTLPTVLMEYDFDKCAYWANDGFLQEIDLDYFAKVAPTYYQMMVDNNYIQYSSLNGKTYFALAERPYSDTNYNWVTFYRKDWLDQLGLSYPEKWSEWLNVYAKIKEAGLATYPAGGTKITGAGVDQNYIYRTYPQDEYAWATTGDYAIPALSTVAQKVLLERRNELYNAGYYDPEFATKSSSDGEADFIAGKTFAYNAYIATDMPVLNSFYETNPNATLGIAPVTTSTDDGAGAVSCAYRVNNAYGMMVGFSATATADQVKAAMMYMEWLIQPDNLFTFQYGFEGKTYDKDANGNAVLRSAENQDSEYLMVARQNKDYFCICIEARKLASIEETVTASYPANYKDSQSFYDQIVKNYYTYKQIIADTPMYAVTDCKFALTLEQAASLQPYLLTQYETYATQLVVCKPEEFDSLYESLSAKYLNDGYQTVIDERAAAYKEGKTSSLPKY